MRIPRFAMERMQSTYENLVEYNLSESGVHPMQVGELLTFRRADGARLAVAGKRLFNGEFGVFNGNNAVSVTGPVRRPAAGPADGTQGEPR